MICLQIWNLKEFKILLLGFPTNLFLSPAIIPGISLVMPKISFVLFSCDEQVQEEEDKEQRSFFVSGSETMSKASFSTAEINGLESDNF